MSIPRQRWVALQIWVGLPLLLAVAAEGAETSAPNRPLDPIVSEVVEMLNAEVSDGLIVQWLESTDRKPADVGSRGLIALTEAGASEQLIETLLALVGERREGEIAAGHQPAKEPRTVEDADARIPIAGSPPATQGGVKATIRLGAKQAWVDEDEPDSPRDQRWDVYLYLDSEFVAWTRPDLKGKPVEAHLAIRPGHRELRVVLQRYEELRKGWSYESLSIPTLVAFEAQFGDPIEIEVDLKRIWGLWRERKQGGPLSYVIRQGVNVLAESTGTGGNPDHWQPICEDVEANFDASDGVPKAFRNSMSRCIRWETLWTGAGKSTSRADILEQLAEYDFEPPVR